MESFQKIHSRVVVLPVNNIDTDQIIPARYLKVTEKTGLGDSLFADWRYRDDGAPVADFVLNQPAARQAQILLAGDNFGCGSSREHAPWALVGFGFRAVISTSFADIFRNNALKNGLVPVEIDSFAHQAMLEILRLKPAAEFVIDLGTPGNNDQVLIWPDGHEVHFPIDPFAKTCLLNGVDELGYILGHLPAIEVYESAQTATSNQQITQR